MCPRAPSHQVSPQQVQWVEGQIIHSVDTDRQTDKQTERDTDRVSKTESQTETDRDSPLFIRYEMEVADTFLRDDCICRLPSPSERSALRLLYVMIAFAGCPVHRRDLSLSSGSAVPA